MLKEIVFEPTYKSYFFTDDGGRLVFGGAEGIAFKILIGDGFVPEDAREAILYARSSLGNWIKLDKFRRELKGTTTLGTKDYSMMRRAFTERDIEDIIKKGPEFRGEKNVEAGKKAIRDIQTVLGAINNGWKRIMVRIEDELDEMDADEVADYVDLLNSLVEFLTALNKYISRFG